MKYSMYSVDGALKKLDQLMNKMDTNMNVKIHEKKEWHTSNWNKLTKCP